MNCKLCQLAEDRKRICTPDVMSPNGIPKVLFIAEAPGVEEDRKGKPMVGVSGQEARHHLTINGITSRGVVLDNVCKCHPPGNRDPNPSEIRTCTEAHLIPMILKMQPKWIITAGAVSTKWILGNDATMEMVHGIPRIANVGGMDVVVIPVYHPAAGLHNPEQMILFQMDMRVAGEVIRGSIPPYPPKDEWEGRERYVEITDDNLEPIEDMFGSDVAIDTEWARGLPWCLSISNQPGMSYVVRHNQTHALKTVNDVVSSGFGETVIHNALYDLPVLAQMGIHPANPVDTMVMAYLLQTEPQGLKQLAYRHCGMKMWAYSEMVSDAGYRLALEYVKAVAAEDWPKPDPVMEWSGGEPKVRQPQDIGRKARKILKDVEEKGADPAARWKAVADGKEVVEDILGPMPEGELPDIPLERAIRYSARDADATIRVYPILMDRIEAMGLLDTLMRDMRAMPMVVDMMANGMPVNLDAFRNLSGYFQARMDEIQLEIQESVGWAIDGKMVNPASYPQMSTVIYDSLKLHEIGGRFKSKKGSVNKSTANEILKRYIDLHPVVQKIIDWREYQKLKTSYADAIPKMVSPDRRIRTTIRMTRVATGRLSSSNPNLMAQPTRSSEGRKVRDCYEASDGCILLSGDYSQVEMRVTASESKDETMLQIFWDGKDIHAETASKAFGLPVDQLDEMKHRYPAKRVGFGILNLITAEGLQRELEVGGAKGWTVKDCEELIHAWFAMYPGVAAYMKSSGEYAKRYGYVRDMWGRIRYIPGIRSNNKWMRIEAERQAGNAPIQMGAQGIIKEGMGRLVPIYRELSALGLGELNPLIQIHDDIVWEVGEDLLPIAKNKIRRELERSAPDGFMVPLEVDFKEGKRWGSLAKG